MSDRSRELTTIQQQTYALLIEHRYINLWTREPTVALQQAWIAAQLGVVRADISNALEALRAARLIRPCGTAAPGRPQIYFLTDEAIAGRPDTLEKIRSAEPHIDPNPERTRKTKKPIGWGPAENRAYEPQE